MLLSEHYLIHTKIRSLLNLRILLYLPLQSTAYSFTSLLQNWVHLSYEASLIDDEGLIYFCHSAQDILRNIFWQTLDPSFSSRHDLEHPMLLIYLGLI